MSGISSYIPYIQISLSIVLIALILLQHSEAGLGGAFGSQDSFGGNGARHTRRGAERLLFNFTILIGVLFVASVVWSLLIAR